MQTISFLATGLKSNQEKYPEVDTCNLTEVGDLRLLKTVGIYGANASGKSNILNALDEFLNAIKGLPSPESRLQALASPFLFQPDAFSTESWFQIIFLIDGKKYRYGFTLRKNDAATEEEPSAEVITSEWLFGPKEKNQTNYFTREGLNIDKDNLPEAKLTPHLSWGHGLFLTHAASHAREGICARIWKYIRSNTISGRVMRPDQVWGTTLHYIRHDKQKLLNFLEGFNIHYSDIEVEEDEGVDFSKQSYYKKEKIWVKKPSKIGSSHAVAFNLLRHESDGTRKLFDLAGILLRGFEAKQEGGLLILDELDSNFHPRLIIQLINMFNNPHHNKTHFQLLFTSHDTNLLDPEIMRRDQFYFTEKNQQEATRLYALSDLKGVRNDADFARQYLAGYYGGVPVLEDLASTAAPDHE